MCACVFACVRVCFRLCVCVCICLQVCVHLIPNEVPVADCSVVEGDERFSPHAVWRGVPLPREAQPQTRYQPVFFNIRRGSSDRLGSSDQ